MNDLTPTPVQPMELSPWLIVLGGAEDAAVALWRIEKNQASALALFADAATAETYATNHCPAPYRILQVENQSLLRVLIDCHQQGVEYAVLNPSHNTSSRIFVVQHILKAARDALAGQRGQVRYP